MPVAKVNPAGGTAGDGRDSWCTPKWLAELIGKVYLDPCSNPRSHIRALHRCMLERGGNGLLRVGDDTWYREATAMDEWKVNDFNEAFINPPYSRGQVLQWVRAYRHCRFIFLLRWDPSTKWFSELFPRCTHVWFPDRRVNFEPPPGVVASSNPYPHALYLRDPKVTLQYTLNSAGYLIPVDKVGHPAQSESHDDLSTGVGNRGSPGGAGEQEDAPRGTAGTPTPNRLSDPGEGWSTYFGQRTEEAHAH